MVWLERDKGWVATVDGGSTALAAKDRNNLRFYVAMHAVASLGAKSPLTAEDIAKIDISALDAGTILESTGLIKTKYEELGGNDQVAKGPSLLEAVKNHLRAGLSATP